MKDARTVIVVEVALSVKNYEGILSAAKRDARDPDHILNVAIDQYLNGRELVG